MPKFRIGRKRGQRQDHVEVSLATEEYSAAAREVTLAADQLAAAAVTEESRIGYNKAGRPYDKRTGRLIKSADLASHEALMTGLTIPIAADTSGITSVCRIIARHLTALADELDGYPPAGNDTSSEPSVPARSLGTIRSDA